MKDNRGFSLIELIITISILGIVIVVGATGIASVSGYSAREACTKVESSLNSLQVSCLSKSKGNATSIKTGGVLNTNLDVYVEIYKESNGKCYLNFYENGKKVVKELASKSVDITYSVEDDGAGAVSVGAEGNGLFLAFSRSTGAFIPQEIGSSDPVSVKYIFFKSGKKEYQLRLMPNTGKVIGEN